MGPSIGQKSQQTPDPCVGGSQFGLHLGNFKKVLRPPPQTMKSEWLGSRNWPEVRPTTSGLWKSVISF